MHNMDCRRQLSPRPAYLAVVPLVLQMYLSVSRRGWQSSRQNSQQLLSGHAPAGSARPSLAGGSGVEQRPAEAPAVTSASISNHLPAR